MTIPPALSLNNGHARSTVACAIVFPILAAISVIGRFVSRYIKNTPLGADDWVILLALVAVSGQMVIIILSVVYGGVGHHTQDVSDANITAFYQLIAAVQFSFGTSLGLAKISLCALLMRIFITRKFRTAAWFVIVYCAGWMIMVISIGAGLCRPFAYNWNKSIPGGKCGNVNSAYIAIAALDIIGDAMIVALPMVPIWKLKTSMNIKLGLTAVFALGIMDIIVAVLRIVYLLQTKFSPDADFLWSSTGTYTWSVIEPSLGVVVACSPTLGPIINLCSTKLRHSLRSGSGRLSWKLGHGKEAYSDISKNSFPLQELGTFSSTKAATNDPHSETANKTTRAEHTTPVPAFVHQQAVPDNSIRVNNEIFVDSRPGRS